ncbi:n19m, NADH-ubiquinone oxidoreductase 9.5 kDa subunit [Parahypoxylon ruwenzoriense]
MSNISPHFWAAPLRYCRWAAREKPAYLWSVIIGTVGLVMLPTVPPALRALGYNRSPPVPLTYPVPPGPRKKLTGYDDE